MLIGELMEGLQRIAPKLKRCPLDNLDQATRILVAFATKGFEKATMSDLAEAAGVSRQTLYNRYGTKEGLLASAAEEFSRSARLRACAELNVGDRTTSECLLAAFSERIGILVPHMHGLPYGSQIVDLGTKLRRHSQADFPEFHADFTKELKFFLQSRGVCRTLTEAADTSFLLLMSAKGLLMNTRTREEFEIGMARIIAAVLHDRHRTSGQMF